MSSGNQRQWPFGAIMPWAKSQSLWHAWGGETPAALAAASKILGWADARRLRSAIVGDAGVFTPTLMTAGGPYNAWAPMPGEAQISYGAEGRIAALLGAADATGGPGFVRLAGLAGGWYFGANPSGQPVYDPATGVAFDGVETDGRINRNSGAESTIHAQLAMLALDARPAAARVAASITGIVSRTGLRAVEAEGGSLTGGAAVVRPPSAWTGEANWSGGAYVDVPAGATVRIPVEARDRDSFVGAVIHRASGPSGTSRWYAVSATGRRTPLGTIANGGAGPKGITENDGVLKPFALAKPLPTGTTAVVVTTEGRLLLDAVQLRPRVSTLVLSTTGGGRESLYVNADAVATWVRDAKAGRGVAYSKAGRAVANVRPPIIAVPGAGWTITSVPATR